MRKFYKGFRMKILKQLKKIVIGLLWILAIFAFILYVALALYTSLGSPPERYLYWQIVIEIASFFGLVIAVWEIIAKPELDVWLLPIDHSNNEIGEISYLHKHSHRTRDNDGFTYYIFRFKLLLGNNGRKAAMHVKIIMSLGERSGEEVPGNYKIELKRIHTRYTNCTWEPSGPYGESGKEQIFHGGTEYICHPHGKKIPKNRKLVDWLANFEVEVPAAHGDKSVIEQPINLYLYANQMNLVEKSFTLRVTGEKHLE